jgi:hypothetical protein
MDTNKSKTKANENESTSIRFDKSFIKKLAKIVDKANKKSFGKKIYAKDIIAKIFEISDEVIVQKVIKESQEDSLSHKDKRELFLKENASKFGGSIEQMEQKMMELLQGHILSTNS